jgi:hypothetical protein
LALGNGSEAGKVAGPEFELLLALGLGLGRGSDSAATEPWGLEGPEEDIRGVGEAGADDGAEEGAEEGAEVSGSGGLPLPVQVWIGSDFGSPQWAHLLFFLFFFSNRQ